jgi:thiamine biosynthesis lipoprotein
MRNISVAIPALWLSILVASCTHDSEHEARRTLFKFGTLIEITLYDVEPKLAKKALDQLENDFIQYHADWTPWETSALSQTNKLLPTGDSFTVPASVLPLIKQSKILSEKSQGLFNPSIGKLIRLWQFHKHDDPDIKPPEKELIDKLVKQRPSMDDLQLDGTKLRSKNPSTELNFGAFAKGYAIDLSMEYLHSLDINNAVINAGGDLRVSGQHGKRPWKIGIRNPREEGVIGWLQAQHNESIFTSGDYERSYIYRNQRYHHILDPGTGYPASGTSSVTVIHDNAGVADAAATALFIAGPQRWVDIAKSMGIKYVMLVDTKGNIHMNPAMEKRIHLQKNHGFNITTSDPLQP